MNKLKMFVVGLAAIFAISVAAPVMAADSTSTSDASSSDTLTPKDCPKGIGKPGNTYLYSVAECGLGDDSNDSKRDNTLMNTIQTIINVVLGVIGLVSVAMIIIGGIQYATSAGDPQKANKAKSTILFAVIGLIVSLLAFAIVNFVLTSVFSS